MTLLIPLGLLGLLSIIALIVIYIIKPNYQHKEVTSTYIWKLSLKYRKRRFPTSKLRNIFLIICQVLALIAGALIMSQPIIRDEKGALDREVIAIIDASASMRTEDENGVTRFERAVDEVIDLSNETITGGGYMSVILSNGNDNFIAQRVGATAMENLVATLNSLIESKDNLACSYGTSNLDDSIALCEDAVRSNPTASIYLYTDSDYAYVPDGMTVVNVSREGEWNVGILDAYTRFEEGYYTFFVEVGCYGGVARNVRLEVSINGANDMNDDGKRETVEYSTDVQLRDNSVTTVIFRDSRIKEADYESEAAATGSVKIVPIGSDTPGQYNKTCVFGYDDVYIHIDEDDSLESDNSFSIYGGRKPELKIQYATTKRKTFFTTLFGVLRNHYSNSFALNVDIVDVPTNDPATEGYDFYLFEGYTPRLMPLDGVVFLFNPSTMPVGLTNIGVQNYNREMYFVQDSEHVILKNTDASKIFVTRLTRLSDYDDSIYRSLWSVDGNPLLLINDGEHEKIIVSLFDIEWSNFGLRNDFAYLIHNIFQTYMPATVSGNAFEVGQEVMLNARGNSLTLSWNSGSQKQELTNLPTAVRLDVPDTYHLSQETYFGKILNETIYVKIPSAESNISAAGITLRSLYRETVDEGAYQDLLVYLAAAMLALLFTEWFLQTQESL